MFFFKKKKAVSDNQSILKNTRESLKAIDEKCYGEESQEKALKNIEVLKESLVKNYHDPDVLKQILPKEADNAEGRRQAKQGQLHPEEWSEQGRLQAANTVSFGIYGALEVDMIRMFLPIANRVANMIKNHGISEVEYPIEGIEWYNYLSAAKTIYKTLNHEFTKLPNDFIGRKFGEYCLSSMKACIEVMETNERESSIYQIPDFVKSLSIDGSVANTIEEGETSLPHPVIMTLLNGATSIDKIIDWTSIEFTKEIKDKNRLHLVNAALIRKYDLKDIAIPLLTDMDKKRCERYEAIYGSNPKK